jgi:hypothetical protein
MAGVAGIARRSVMPIAMADLGGKAWDERRCWGLW